MFFSAIVLLLIIAAGISILAVLFTLGVHDVLRRFHRNILQLDTVFAHVFGAKTERDKLTHGPLSLFVVGWASVIAFLIVWRLPVFTDVTHGSVVFSAFMFGLALYLALMIVFLPIYRLGAFGRGHDRLVPYWGALFVLVFVVAVAVLVALSM